MNFPTYNEDNIDNWINVQLPNLHNMLTKLRATSATNEKKIILQEQLNNSQTIEIVKALLYFTYSPTENFYIKPQKNKDNLFGFNFHTNDENIMQDFTFFDALKFLQNKVRGNNAIDFYHDFKHFINQNPKRHFENELFDLVLDKDLKAGVAANTINSVFSGLIPKMPYMRCSLLKDIHNPERWLNKEIPIFVQEKMDGMFINLNVKSYKNQKNIEILSRVGTVFPESAALQPLFDIAKELPSEHQYHGELLIWDKNNQQYLAREIGNGILNSIAKETKSKSKVKFESDQHELRFVVWDSIPFNVLKEQQISDIYTNRIEQLNQSIKNLKSEIISLVPTKICYSLEEAQKIFQTYLQEGKEGVCLKLSDMKWSNTTNKDIIKLKSEFEVDLKMIDFIEGKGKNAKTFGSIRCQSEDGQLIVDVSGFSDDMRKTIFNNKDDYIGNIITVKAASITQSKINDNKYSLFLPRFVEFRQDKNTADDLLRIEAQFNEASHSYNPVEILTKKLKDKNELKGKNKFKSSLKI